MGYLSKAVAYLPAQVQNNASAGLVSKPLQVTDTLAQSRAWATVSVPSAGVPNIVTIASLTKQVSQTHLLYKWAFPQEDYFQPVQI